MSSTPDLPAESERLFLIELLAAPDGVAGMTSAPPPYDRRPFGDGGRWRGAIPQALERAGIIERVTTTIGAAAAVARRPSRHRTILRRWRLIDRPAAESRLAELDPRTRPTDRNLFDGFN